MQRMSAKEETQHYYEMCKKEKKNENSGCLARALFKMKYNRKMRGFKSAESINGY